MTTLVAAFVLGWHLALRRRARLNKAAFLAAKDVPYKVQSIDPTHIPAPGKHGLVGIDPALASAPSKPGFIQLDVVKQGVIALANSWRRKWHGLP